MNSIQVYLYTSILWQLVNSLQSPLPISCYTLCPWPPLPCTLLLYPSTLYYSPYSFHNPHSYTQSPTSPSALFHTLATPLLQMPHKCRHLCMAVKLKKRGLSLIVSFLYPRTCIVGFVILCMGSLWLASLPGPITLDFVSKNCKVYLLTLKEKKTLDIFL